MTLHLMFLFLHNMAGEDTGQGKNDVTNVVSVSEGGDCHIAFEHFGK